MNDAGSTVAGGSLESAAFIVDRVKDRRKIHSNYTVISINFISVLCVPAFTQPIGGCSAIAKSPSLI